MEETFHLSAFISGAGVRQQLVVTLKREEKKHSNILLRILTCKHFPEDRKRESEDPIRAL